MSSGAETGTSRSLSAGAPEVQYRPISSMAIVSLALGVLSTLAFADPVFWVLAGIGLAVAATTSYKLERARGEYAGQFMATAGVLISVVCLVGAPTRYFITYFLLTRESRQEADRFIDGLLENRLGSAFMITQPIVNRMNSERIDDVIDRGKEQFRFFLSSQITAALAGKGKDTTVRYMGPGEYEILRGGAYRIKHAYRLKVEKPKGNPDYWELVIDIFSGNVASASGDVQGRLWQISAPVLSPMQEQQFAGR